VLPAWEATEATYPLVDGATAGTVEMDGVTGRVTIGTVADEKLEQPAAGTVIATARETLPVGPALNVIAFVPAPDVIVPLPIVHE
jgi:hypothetical protein